MSQLDSFAERSKSSRGRKYSLLLKTDKKPADKPDHRKTCYGTCLSAGQRVASRTSSEKEKQPAASCSVTDSGITETPQLAESVRRDRPAWLESEVQLSPVPSPCSRISARTGLRPPAWGEQTPPQPPAQPPPLPQQHTGGITSSRQPTLYFYFKLILFVSQTTQASQRSLQGVIQKL